MWDMPNSWDDLEVEVVADPAQDYYDELSGINELKRFLDSQGCTEGEVLIDTLWEDGCTVTEIEDILEDKGYI